MNYPTPRNPVNDPTPTVLRMLLQRYRSAVEMAVTLRRDGTPLATALEKAEQRIGAGDLPPGLPEETLATARSERALMLDLVRRARLEPGAACAGQDPLDWLLMVLEDRAGG